ncbi:MAG: rod shape-determining protein MreD [Actinomycetales bacterium]|nr:MAG: rod shape-determining protein MreD [Actinomycetales bacterium]
MSWSRTGLVFLFLLLVFIIQESAISKINFPVAGFSGYLAVLLSMMALEDRSGAIVFGFIGGLILDFSPSSDSPFGKWALVLTIIGYFFSTNRESIGNFTQRPGSFVLLVAVGSIATLLSFLALGVLLGENSGSLGHNVITVVGNGVWTLLFTPLLLPGLVKWRGITLSSRERK